MENRPQSIAEYLNLIIGAAEGGDQEALYRISQYAVKALNMVKEQRAHPRIGWVKGDYDRLYDQLKANPEKRIVCYVDYDGFSRRDGSVPCRDICTVRGTQTEFLARGIGYGGAPSWYDEEHRKEEFLQECDRLNVEWLDESASPAAVKPTFWDVAKAFKWATEYRDEIGGQLTLYNDQWTIISENEDGNENETQDLTPGNVAELYCLHNGFTKEAKGTAVSQDAHEKEVMMHAFDKVRQIFEGRQWVMEGRGSHPYNDDRYREEVRYMYDEFDRVVKDTWANIKSKSVDYRRSIIAEYLASPAAGREDDAVSKVKEIAVAFMRWNSHMYKEGIDRQRDKWFNHKGKCVANSTPDLYDQFYELIIKQGNQPWLFTLTQSRADLIREANNRDMGGKKEASNG